MRQRIILLIMIFTSTTLVHGRSQPEESPIETAKELLEEKKYNEAIAILTAYMSANPETIFEVQPLLEEIREMRYSTNETMDELLYVLYEEEDLDKAYELIEKIEDDNPFPDQLSKVFLRDAREGATFVINQRNFKEYMDRALEHLQNGEYNLALDNYLLCLDFHSDEFDILLERFQESGESPVDLEDFDDETSVNSYLATLKNSSFREVASISENSKRLQNYITALQESYQRADRIIDSQSFNIEALRGELEIFSELPIYVDAYNDANTQLTNYNTLFENISTRGLQSKYISYATLTLNGRKEKDEGFLYLSERLYPVYLQALINKAEQLADNSFNNALTYLDEGSYRFARDEFLQTINHLNVLMETASFWKSFVGVGENLKLTGTKVVRDKYHYLEDSYITIELIKTYNSIIDYYVELNEDSNREDYDIYRIEIEERLAQVEILLNQWQSERDRVNSRTLVNFIKSPDRIENILSEISSTQSSYITREVFIMDKVSNIDYVAIFDRDIVDGEAVTEDIMGDRIYALSLPTTTPETINIYFGLNNTDERTLDTYNPQIALDDLNVIEVEYDSFIDQLNLYKSKFENEKDYIFKNPSFNGRYQSVINALEMAEDNKISLAAYKIEANKKLDLSSISQARGYDLYDDAVVALERERFNEARELINDSRKESEVAVSYNKNRFVIDDLIPALYELEERIAKEEARIVIRDVRNLINQGKRLYLEGSFIPASDAFKKAELRWADTNTEAHPEIPYWLALIKSSLDVESGRYLLMTDTWYNVLAGYLNFAEKNYNLARKENNKVDKINYLKIAESYLDKVLEIRSFNERARYLQLLVSKEQDPDKFQVTFNNELIRSRNSIIRTVDRNEDLASNQMLNVLSSFEAIIKDAYLAKPRLSNTARRGRLERFYLQNPNADQDEITEGRQSIQDSYLRLKDLYRIAEGQQRTIVARLVALCEVALGFKRLPVDTSNIRESNAIFARARTRLNNTSESDVDSLTSILDQLKKALLLNPGNEDIPVAMDEILVLLGEESRFQLQPAEDKLFREAQRFFIEGRFFDARDNIIEILRADSKNKNNPELKELINRVEVKLKEEIVVE